MIKGSHAVFGATGFVGGNLMRALPGAAGFTSANAAGSAGAGFDTLWCAAAPGSMFEANKFPERDADRLAAIAAALAATQAKRLVLISTIAVLPAFDGGHDESVAAFQTETPYGRNRRALEAACEEAFAGRLLILRLPALYGPGLAKNFLFDLLNPVPTMLTPGKHEELAAALGGADPLAGLYAWDEALGMHKIDRAALAAHPDRVRIETVAQEAGITATAFHNPATTYQYYGLETLVADAGRALDAGLAALHLAPPPLRVADIHLALTGRDMAPNAARLHAEDMRTAHAALWDADGPYIAGPDATLAAVKSFYDRAKGAAA